MISLVSFVKNTTRRDTVSAVSSVTYLDNLRVLQRVAISYFFAKTSAKKLLILFVKGEGKGSSAQIF